MAEGPADIAAPEGEEDDGARAGPLVGAGEMEGQRQPVVGQAADAAPRPIFEFTASSGQGGHSYSLKCEDKQLAAGAIVAGLGLVVIIKLDGNQLLEAIKTVGSAAVFVGTLTYLWKTNKESTERAMRDALEGTTTNGAHAPDPEIEDIHPGSLIVKIRCHTEESLIQFVLDYDSGKVKKRLEKELSKIGFTAEVTVTIENRKELEAQSKNLRDIMITATQKSTVSRFAEVSRKVPFDDSQSQRTLPSTMQVEKKVPRKYGRVIFNQGETLQEAFEEFKEGKASLQRIHEGTVECFEKILGGLTAPGDAALRTELEDSPSASPSGEDIPLSVEDVQLGLDLSDVLYSKAEKDEVERLFSQEPALIVIGQTNCGKSSIINELLGAKALPTSDGPCTARIVRVTYSEESYVKLQAGNGTILEESKLTGKSKVPRSMIELSKSDREDPNKAGASLVVGLNNDFLKAGVDIIDSPGKNENQVLDNLVNKQLENVLPVIIYVVDGHNLFTSQDRTALTDITKQDKQLDIFYVVSKIDPEERLSSDEEEEEEENEKEVERVQESKKRRVKEKLLKLGYLPKEDAEIKERLHGLSAWKINQAKNNPDEYTRDFEHFKECLQRFYKASLRANIDRVASLLITVLSRCLEFFIQKANALQSENKATMEMLQTAKEEEEKVHEAIKSDLEAKREDIKEVIEETIKEAEEGILKAAGELEYDTAEIRDLTADGFVKSTAARDACVDQVRHTVMNKLQAEISVKLQQMFTSKDEFAKKLEEQVRNLEKETRDDDNSSTAAHALAQSLVTFYEVQLETPATKSGYLRAFGQAFVDIWKGLIKQGWKGLKEALSGKFFVGDPKWKEDVAKRQLQAIKADKVTTDLIEKLQEHFDDCHDRFAAEVEKIIKLCEQGETMKDEQRKRIQALAPDVAMLEMLTYSVLDNMRFGVPKCGDQIGGGAQGKVYACENIRSPSGKPCVVKEVPIASDDQLKDLTLELHNTRALNHKNILPLLCTSIAGSSSLGYRVSLVLERMKCDLYEALPTLPSLRTRLNIALEVAEALQYVHKQGMIHRDVKTQNVLIDENNHAKLTDMGLCKPEGLVTGSLVGTPLNMAPEMIARKYDKTVDVYAFGVLLWRVCEGKGNHPQNIHKHCNPLVMLYLNAFENKTPERLEEFPESCWNLMEKCWSFEPEDRPSFDVVVEDLKKILEEPDIL